MSDIICEKCGLLDDKNKFLNKACERISTEYKEDFKKWVSENCIQKTNEVFIYKNSEYLYFGLPILYANQTEQQIKNQ
jgi:hypothetical protein